MNFWFSADYHWDHKNILQLATRPFSTILQNDEEIIERNNSLVKNNDKLFILGDLSYKTTKEYTVSCLKRLNGKKIVIWGNHDKALRAALQCGLLTEMLNSGELELIGPSDHRLSTSMEMIIHKQLLVLSHYAYRTWHHAFRNAVHLYGHSHGKLPPLFRSIDVGVDNNNYYPFSFEEIMYYMDGVKDDFREI